jgi:hypothetical protein
VLSEPTVADIGVKVCWESECVGSAPVNTAILQVLKKWPKLYPNFWIYLLITELYYTLIFDIYIDKSWRIKTTINKNQPDAE